MALLFQFVFFICIGKWTGPWFPNPPGRENYHPSNTQQSINSDNNDSNNIVKPVTKQMGLVNPACDNAQVIFN